MFLTWSGLAFMDKSFKENSNIKTAIVMRVFLLLLFKPFMYITYTFYVEYVKMQNC